MFDVVGIERVGILMLLCMCLLQPAVLSGCDAQSIDQPRIERLDMPACRLMPIHIRGHLLALNLLRPSGESGADTKWHLGVIWLVAAAARRFLNVTGP